MDKSKLGLSKLSILKILPWSLPLLTTLWALISPLSHDELSAISRAEINGFMNFIRNGILADAHPPLVGMVLYVWINLGLPLILLKGLFGFFGGLALKLLVDKAKSPTSFQGLGVFAMTGYFLFYAGQLRPYGLGLLFTVLFFLSLPKSEENKGKPIHTVVFGLLACASHYIAGLSILLLFIASFFWNKPSQFKSLALRGWWMIFFGAPLLPFLFHQMNHKGLAWLGKPKFDFLIDFFGFLGGDRLWAGVLFLIPLLTGFYFGRKNKILLLSGIALLSAFFIQYLYSIFRAPILQFSGLIFLFPIVYALCLEQIPKFKYGSYFFLAMGICTFLGNHILGGFIPNYQAQPFKAAQAWLSPETPCIMGVNPDYVGRFGSLPSPFLSIYGAEQPAHRIQSEMEQWAGARKIQSLGVKPWQYHFITENHYQPKSIQNYYTAQGIEFEIDSSLLSLESAPFPEKEYHHLFQASLDDVLDHAYEHVWIQLHHEAEAKSLNTVLIAEVSKGDEKKLYRSRQLRRGEVRTDLIFPVDQLGFSEKDLKDYTLSITLRNPEKTEINLGYRIGRFPGNPIRLSIFTKK